MIKLSIIVPLYNIENYIVECIDSLLSQTLKEIEIIIVDDGSTDDSFNKVSKYKDKRITVIRKKNGGLSSARNKGLENAKGDYIAFVDSDDFICINTAYEEMTEIEAQAAGLPLLVSDVVTREVDITEETCFFSLKESTSSWAERLLEIRANERKDNFQRVVDSGYDIEMASRWLETFYFSI